MRRAVRTALTRMRPLVLAVLAVLACQTQPIYEVDQATVPNDPTWTLDDMTLAIQRAGARRGWDMRLLEPGHIEGRFRKPDAKVVIDVRYSRYEFSIHYKSSEHLDHSGDRIQNSYNRWVYNLERDIRREFLRMRPTEEPRKAPGGRPRARTGSPAPAAGHFISGGGVPMVRRA